VRAIRSGVRWFVCLLPGCFITGGSGRVEYSSRSKYLCQRHGGLEKGDLPCLTLIGPGIPSSEASQSGAHASFWLASKSSERS
jgi:hypothetical protein